MDTSGHEGRVKADDVTLLLNIVASSEESSVKSIEITFRSEDGKFALWQSHCSAANWTFANFRILRPRLYGLQRSA